jgi:putative RNA 2'-phosphotransferase
VNRSLTRQSRFLSLVLRHKPEAAGVTLDRSGWVEIGTLVEGAVARGARLTEALVREIARTDAKRRYTLSDDNRRIRANYGHSVPVELDLEASPPPELLYHGTASRSLGLIMAHGLEPRRRQYVHLSEDAATAVRVGSRHGTPVVLEVEAAEMARDGHSFFRTEGGTWLTRAVPCAYIRTCSNLGRDEMSSQTRAGQSLGRELIAESKRRLLDQSLPRLKKCLELLSEEEIWFRPNTKALSVGNLVLHLCGNVTQHIVSGLGGAPDTRRRAEELRGAEWPAAPDRRCRALLVSPGPDRLRCQSDEGDRPERQLRLHAIDRTRGVGRLRVAVTAALSPGRGG